MFMRRTMSEEALNERLLMSRMARSEAVEVCWTFFEQADIEHQNNVDVIVVD